MVGAQHPETTTGRRRACKSQLPKPIIGGTAAWLATDSGWMSRDTQCSRSGSSNCVVGQTQLDSADPRRGEIEAVFGSAEGERAAPCRYGLRIAGELLSFREPPSNVAKILDKEQEFRHNGLLRQRPALPIGVAIRGATISKS